LGALALLALIGSAKTAAKPDAEPESENSFRLDLDDRIAAAKTIEYTALLRAVRTKVTKPIATIARFTETPTLSVIRQCRAEVANLDLDLAALETLLVRDFPTGGAK